MRQKKMLRKTYAELLPILGMEADTDGVIYKIGSDKPIKAEGMVMKLPMKKNLRGDSHIVYHPMAENITMNASLTVLATVSAMKDYYNKAFAVAMGLIVEASYIRTNADDMTAKQVDILSTLSGEGLSRKEIKTLNLILSKAAVSKDTPIFDISLEEDEDTVMKGKRILVIEFPILEVIEDEIDTKGIRKLYDTTVTVKALSVLYGILMGLIGNTEEEHIVDISKAPWMRLLANTAGELISVLRPIAENFEGDISLELPSTKVLRVFKMSTAKFSTMVNEVTVTKYNQGSNPVKLTSSKPKPIGRKAASVKPRSRAKPISEKKPRSKPRSKPVEDVNDIPPWEEQTVETVTTNETGGVINSHARSGMPIAQSDGSSYDSAPTSRKKMRPQANNGWGNTPPSNRGNPNNMSPYQQKQASGGNAWGDNNWGTWGNNSPSSMTSEFNNTSTNGWYSANQNGNENNFWNNPGNSNSGW